MDTELRQVNTNNEAIKQNYLELTELREVLTKTQTYFKAVSHTLTLTLSFFVSLSSLSLIKQNYLELTELREVLTKTQRPTSKL